MTSRIESEPAFVLHTRPYQNTSLLVDLFTQNHGRISALARSARGIKSRYKNSLRPFCFLCVNWTGTRDLKNLSLVEFAEVPTQLYGDAIACGFYANELLVKLLHCDDAMPILFHAYKKLLQMLSSQEKQLAALRYFEKTLLKELGYAINLQQDIENELPIEPENYYQYIPQKGFRKNFSPNDYDFLGAHLFAGS